jgi:hypothetical protein
MMDFTPAGGNGQNGTRDYYTGGDPNGSGNAWASWETQESCYYGPSSGHPAVCVVAMGDGSGAALSKQTDAANLFFLVTKNNSDPFYMP